MKKEKGGITRPKGFFAGAIHCGIKHKNNDLCLIYSEVPAKAAGVFTSNRVKAAPLVVSMKYLTNGTAQAIVVNSGNANCMTGKTGLNDAELTAKSAAKTLAIKKENVLTASTGVIGKRLPVLKIVSSIKELVSSLSPTGSKDVARAIMTTDTVPKETAVSLKIGSNVVNIGAVAKGAGMINPNMATMLAFITTDAAISKGALKKALKESVDATFNCITVDGDMSTNDCVFILANGLADNKEIMSTGRDYELFERALTSVCSTMAEMIVRDAEGATKFITVNVRRAKSVKDAKKAAYAIATSPLVKTAIYGEDPNWGRIAAAIGRSGADFNPAKLDIYLGKAKVLFRGASAAANKNLLRKIFRKRDIEVSAVLNSGNSEATLLTSDLSKEYVDINAHYTS
jgi:glutamate N-acetyltransferase/amino-acid N-acetyltransferase